MTLERVDKSLRCLGGLAAYTALAVLLMGIWRGTRRQAGRTSGAAARWLRSGWFYLFATMLFIIICYAGWIPLPVNISPAGRIWLLASGGIIYFPGMAFILWGRLALGHNYFVSSARGAQLFSGHQLITSGPYAIVRHPMYSGLMIAAVGSLCLYPTWTTLAFTCLAPFIAIRARHEEAALAAEFGERWVEYSRHVPAFFPRVG